MSDRIEDLAAAFGGKTDADFSRAFNWLVGDLAADNEDCTDSRAFRLAGFGALAADPEIGA